MGFWGFGVLGFWGGVLRADDAMSEEVPEARVDDDEDAPPPLDDEPFPDRPDLVLIDGGLGQLAVAREVLAGYGICDVALVGVAKGPDRDAGREHFHIPGRLAPLMLEPRDPVLYFVQRLRDEAHRFAIGTHRAKRSKRSASTRSTRSTASGRRASARCSTISARRRRCHARASTICWP